MQHLIDRLSMILLAAALVGAFGLHAASAQGGYPHYGDLYVNDFAGLLTSGDTASVRAMLTDLKTGAGIEATVVTINSIHDYGTGDETIESFATNLFNNWGIGDAAKDNGVLLLVAVADREVRVELGSGYASGLDADMRTVIDENIIPAFRTSDYSRGIVQGTRAVVHALTGSWPGESGEPLSAQPPVSASGSSTVTVAAPSAPALPAGVAVAGGAAGLAALAVGLRRYRRYRPRRCPNCGSPMVRLDETSDDIYLDSGQKLEEVLNSVDYDVWKCETCNYHTLESFGNWFSRNQNCPQCHYRTMQVSSDILENATYSSTGRKRITRACQNCHYHDEQIVILPVLTRTHTSSGSSGGSSSGHFGGGSSSGGGASGKW